MLKPPESLPFEYVDELIDNSIVFYCTYWENQEHYYLVADPYPMGGAISNHAQQMINLKQDFYLTMEDEDGYAINPSFSGEAMVVEFDDLPDDKEIDHWVKTDNWHHWTNSW